MNSTKQSQSPQTRTEYWDEIDSEMISGKTDAFIEPKVVRSQIVFTRRFWWLVALGCPIIGLSWSQGQPWVLYGYNGFLVLVAWLTSRLTPDLQSLRFRRRMDAVLSVRAPNRIRIEIENDLHEGIRGKIRDEAPSTHRSQNPEHRLNIEPGKRFRYDYFVTPPERGPEFFRGTFLRLECPFGLVERQVLLGTEQQVEVYPNLQALKEFQILNQPGRLREIGIRKARMKGLGTEFESLREYSEGDDYRKVDWKATARRSKLIVREYEVERNQVVMIAIDCGRHMMAEVDGVRKLDLVLDSVLFLIQAALTAGDNVGLLAYSDDVVRYIPPKKGQRQIGILLNSMATLFAEPLESDPVRAFGYLATRHKRRSLLLNFTSVDDADRAKEVMTGFGSFSRGHIALVVNVNDPKFREALKKSPNDTSSLFQFASAHYLTEERRKAASLLRTSGFHLLDSEPQDLAKDLVNYYLDVKARGKL